jgi:hypothetical protein
MTPTPVSDDLLLAETLELDASPRLRRCTSESTE